MIRVRDLLVKMFIFLSEEQLVQDKEVLIAKLEGSPGVFGYMDGVILILKVGIDG